MKLRILSIMLALLLATPVLARDKTDVLVMNNGDRLHCEIKGLQGGVLYASFDYILSTQSVEWSKVAHLESHQLFIVKTEGGLVYSGTLSTVETVPGRPVELQVIEVSQEIVTIDTDKVVTMSGTAKNFWGRFNGDVSLGLNYAKGNQSTQYNFGTQTEYLRERWSAQASYNSSLSSSTGADTSTRNQLTFSGDHLLRRNNYFYEGIASFLQSSEQDIDLQSNFAGLLGRYFKNTNRWTVSLAGGLAYQNTRYGQSADSSNIGAAIISGQVRMFRFNKTTLNLTAQLMPAITEPGRVHFNTNAAYYLKLWSNLNWNISFYGNWDNRPPPGLSGSDYGSSIGLTWTYGLK
jgi:hypothetical protein